MYTLQELLFSAALAVYMTASVFVAVVRWGHRCQPYARHMDYYFPAWKSVIGCFLSNLVMLPALFMPTETDAILQLRLLLILASPFFCAVLMFSYFGKMLKASFWQKPIRTLAIPFAAMVLTATVLALVPGTQMDPGFCQWFFSIGGLLALAYLACFLMAFIMVARQQRHVSEDNYSNPDDFPHRFASGIIWLSLVHLVVSWTVSFIGTRLALTLGLLVLSVLCLVFLIGVLTPHRSRDVARLEAEDAPEEDDMDPDPEQEPEEPVLSPERQEEIVRAIRQYVEQEQAYLDSHLTLDALSRHVGINSKYISLVMKSRLGGFFAYVNRCRLSHAARLQVEEPGIPVGEVIDRSGFGSRTTYYKIRRQLEA
jgi:AraC-like DNA-binding protein